jgi:hypothetical protein
MDHCTDAEVTPSLQNHVYRNVLFLHTLLLGILVSYDWSVLLKDFSSNGSLITISLAKAKA